MKKSASPKIKKLKREIREWRKAARYMSNTNAINAGPLWDKVGVLEEQLIAINQRQKTGKIGDS